MAVDQYRGRAAGVLAQSKLEPGQRCCRYASTIRYLNFQQLAEQAPALPVVFRPHASLWLRGLPIRGRAKSAYARVLNV